MLNDRSYNASSSSLAARHGLLRRRYELRPESAIVVKRVHTGPADGRDLLHGAVVPENMVDPADPYGVTWGYGIDQAVGGLHDAPNPAELLCAALAACADGTVRMIAALQRVELEELEVQVSGLVDVRGTLGLDLDVPVGFQALTMAVRLRAAPDTPPGRIDRLTAAAERACVVLDTLRTGVEVGVTFDTAPRKSASSP
jgi:uncharacterized OsmC-like protein